MPLNLGETWGGRAGGYDGFKQVNIKIKPIPTYPLSAERSTEGEEQEPRSVFDSINPGRQ